MRTPVHLQLITSKWEVIYSGPDSWKPSEPGLHILGSGALAQVVLIKGTGISRSAHKVDRAGQAECMVREPRPHAEQLKPWADSTNVPYRDVVRAKHAFAWGESSFSRTIHMSSGLGASRGESGPEDIVVHPSIRNYGGIKLYDIVCL